MRKNKYQEVLSPRIKCCPANSLTALMWRWFMNSKQAVLQLRVEGSRRGEGEQRKKTPNTWLIRGWRNGAKTVVYNTKEDSKKRGTKKEIQEKKERKRWKKYNNKKEEFFIIDHTDMSCLRILFVCMHVWLFPFNTIYQYLYSRFGLAFSPTLYKFIVRAFWAWVHSCSGFKSKLVLTLNILFFKLLFKKFLVVFARIIMFIFLLKKLNNEFAIINCLVMLFFKKWEKFVNLKSKYYLNG